MRSARDGSRGAGMGREEEIGEGDGDRHRSVDFTMKVRENHRRVIKP